MQPTTFKLFKCTWKITHCYEAQSLKMTWKLTQSDTGGSARTETLSMLTWTCHQPNTMGMFYIEGPGHGRRNQWSNSYLDGSYTEFKSNIPTKWRRFQTLSVKIFSFQGGIASHAALKHQSLSTKVDADMPFLTLRVLYWIIQMWLLPQLSRWRWRRNRSIDGWLVVKPSWTQSTMGYQLQFSATSMEEKSTTQRYSSAKQTKIGPLLWGLGWKPIFAKCHCGWRHEAAHALFAEKLDKNGRNQKVQAEARKGSEEATQPVYGISRILKVGQVQKHGKEHQSGVDSVHKFNPSRCCGACRCPSFHGWILPSAWIVRQKLVN